MRLSIFVVTGVLRCSGGAAPDGPLLQPSDHVANQTAGGRVPVPDALFGTQRGQQHLPLSADQSAEAAEGRAVRVRGQRLRAENAVVVPARGVRPGRGMGPQVRGRTRADRARQAGGRAQDPTPPVVLLPVRKRHAERAPGRTDNGVRGRLPKRRGDRRVLSVRAVREVHGQRLDRHRTGVPEHRRGLLAQLGIGHVEQMAPGTGHARPETSAV